MEQVIFVQGEERRQRAGKKNEEEEERQINKVIQVLVEAEHFECLLLQIQDEFEFLKI